MVTDATRNLGLVLGLLLSLTLANLAETPRKTTPETLAQELDGALRDETLSPTDRIATLRRILGRASALGEEGAEAAAQAEPSLVQALAARVVEQFRDGARSFDETRDALQTLREDFPRSSAGVQGVEAEVNRVRLEQLRAQLHRACDAIDASAVNERQRLRERLGALETYVEQAVPIGEDLAPLEEQIVQTTRALEQEEDLFFLERFEEATTSAEGKLRRKLMDEKASRDARKARGGKAGADEQSILRLEDALFTVRLHRLRGMAEREKLSVEEQTRFVLAFLRQEAQQADSVGLRTRVQQVALEEEGFATQREFQRQACAIDRVSGLSSQERDRRKGIARAEASQRLHAFVEEFNRLARARAR